MMDSLVSFELPKKRQSQHKLKKAPGAPRRFKSAFIFFSTQKHREIRESMGEQSSKAKTTNVAKLVSEAWKNLTPQELEPFEELARKDKARYEIEKRMYSGPWKVSAEKIRDPKAPKRPCSAFLSFSNNMRDRVKKRFPTASSAEILRELAKMWKDSPERQVFIQRELASREQYKAAIAEWRAIQRKPDEDARQHREDIALKTLEAQEDGISTTEVGVVTSGTDCVARPIIPANILAGFSTNMLSGTNGEGFEVVPLSSLNNQNSSNYLVNSSCHNHDDLGLNICHSLGGPLDVNPAGGFQKITPPASTPLSTSLAAMMQMSIFSQPTDTYPAPAAAISKYGSLGQAQQQWQQQEQLQQLHLEQLQQLHQEQLEQFQQEQHQHFYQMQLRQLDFNSEYWQM